MRHTTSCATFLLLSSTLALSAEVTRHPVAIATAGDSFLLANSSSTSGATIFSGDKIVAGKSNCQLKMSDGNQITLAPNASAELYDHRVVLLSGKADTFVNHGLQINTQDFTVIPLTAKTHATLEVSKSAMTLDVVEGQTRVLDTRGVELSQLETGTTLRFVTDTEGPQSADKDPAQEGRVRLVGVVDRQDGHYLIRDRFTNKVWEIVGDIPPRFLNYMTIVDGYFDPQKPDAPQFNRVAKVEQIKRIDAAFGGPCGKDGTGSAAKRVELNGTLQKTGEHYFVEDPRKGVTEVVGDVDTTQVGTKVNLKGFVLTAQSASTPAQEIVYPERRKLVANESPCMGAIITGTVITGALVSAIELGPSGGHPPISF